MYCLLVQYITRRYPGKTPEIQNKAFPEIIGRSDKQIDLLNHCSRFLHAAMNPIRPSGHIRCSCVFAARKINLVAVTGAFFITLSRAEHEIIPTPNAPHEELPPGTHEPIVVKHKDNGNFSVAQYIDNASGEVVQVPDVGDIGANFIHEPGKNRVQPRVAVTVLALRMIDIINRQIWIVLTNPN